MKITVFRDISNDDATLGRLEVDGEFFCYTLEDEHRDKKVMHETRIPAGSYRVALRTVGGMTRRYADRFPSFHEGMLWIRDVPEFKWIYIHCGNTDDHTSGCILVGEERDETAMKLSQSVIAYSSLYNHVVDAARDDQLEIEIIDNDRQAED